MPSGVAGAASKRVSQSTTTLSLVLRWNPVKTSYREPKRTIFWQSQKDIFVYILLVTPCTTEKLPKDQQRIGNYISSLGKTRLSHEKIVGCARNSESSLD